jgi:hypothetical protein
VEVPTEEKYNIYTVKIIVVAFGSGSFQACDTQCVQFSGVYINPKWIRPFKHMVYAKNTVI